MNGASGSAQLVIGGIIVIIGAWFLLEAYVPALDLGRFWPVALIAIGLAILAAGMRARPPTPPSGPAEMTATPCGGGPRGGPLIAATWLIGLGVLFLVRDFSGLSWGEAWPLFIIWIGVGTLVSQLVRLGRAPIGAWSLVWPLAWIAVGSVLLLSTTQVIEASPGELIARWWPVVPIVIGAWFLVAAVLALAAADRRVPSLPLEGGGRGRRADPLWRRPARTGSCAGRCPSSRGPSLAA